MPPEYAEEAVREAIEKGAITDAYRAERTDNIQKLYQLRATEIASYLQ
jgi:hypothetical protein